MTIGEHLEELRRRIILGLGGFVIAMIPCTLAAKYTLEIICRPMQAALQASDQNSQLFADEPTEAFMAWVQVSLILALMVAGPWVVYQIWLFIAAGLYPKERKGVTRYIPLAIGLGFTGMAFVYFAVLPLTMRFFVAFTVSIGGSSPVQAPPAGFVPGNTPPTFIQSLAADPPNPGPFQLWFNVSEKRLKFFDDGKARIVPFSSDTLIAAHFKLSEYLDLVFRLLITFGLCFQLPLVVLALAKIGIVTVEQLRSWRRYVYFAMTVLAALVSPGDVITATLALLAPLLVLYELGILLARMSEKKANATEA